MARVGNDYSNLYELLLKGRKVEMSFSSQKDATSFRTALARFKRVQDALLLGIGFFDNDLVPSLSFKKLDDRHNFLLAFEQREEKQMSFKVLDDGILEVGEDADEMEREEEEEKRSNG